MVKQINTEEFENEVLKSKEPVFVDFFATWCGPCRMLAPVMEEVGEKAKVVKVDIDEEDTLAEKYNIMSIPCVVLFKDGKEFTRSVGFRQVDDILDMLN